MVRREVWVERDIENSLLEPREVQIQLKEGRCVRRRVRRWQYLDGSGKFYDEHAAVGKELDIGWQVESRGQYLVLKEVGVGDVDGDGVGNFLITRKIGGPRSQRMRAVDRRARVPLKSIWSLPALEPGGHTVNKELHSKDTNIVASICSHEHDVADLGAWDRRGDRHGRWCRV